MTSQVAMCEYLEGARTMSAEPDPQDVDNTALSSLQSIFGHCSFRPLQLEAIRAVMSKNDALCLFPTGGGKSLCYQLPPLALRANGVQDAVAIVISPLLALMEDQVLSLCALAGDDAACFLGSSQLDHAVQSRAIAGQYAVVYMTPEKVVAMNENGALQRLHNSVTLSCFAVDEAHCVSEWGHEFRPEFRQLQFLHIKYPSVPILALSATATPKVQDDILSSLSMHKAVVLRLGFNRPNLCYSVHKKRGVESDVAQFQRLMVGLGETPSTIVYTTTRADTEKLATALEKLGLRAAAYHAGMTHKVRSRVHHAFARDDVQCVCATVAFGMGIDKPDVRIVIHYGLPKSLEAYSQQTGRAGRDGELAMCVLFHSDSDAAKTQSLISTQAQFDRFRSMLKYANSSIGECRRRILLRHFGEEVGERCAEIGGESCDQCLRNAKKATSNTKSCVHDLTNEARLLLQAIHETGSRYGMVLPIKFLRGSTEKRLAIFLDKDKRPRRMDSIHGAGTAHSEEYWKALHHLIQEQGLLDAQLATGGGFRSFSKSYTVYRLSPKGLELINSPINQPPSFRVFAPSNANPVLRFALASYKYSESNSDAVTLTSCSRLKGVEAALYNELVKLRKAMANRIGINPYMIFQEATMVGLAKRRPTNKSLMKTISGIGNYKLSQHGDEFIAAIRKFCEKNGIDTNVFSPKTDISVSSSSIGSSAVGTNNGWIRPVKHRKLPTTTPLTVTKKITNMCNCGLAPAQISVQLPTVGGIPAVLRHLSSSILAGDIVGEISPARFKIRAEVVQKIQTAYNGAKAELVMGNVRAIATEPPLVSVRALLPADPPPNAATSGNEWMAVVQLIIAINRINRPVRRGKKSKLAAPSNRSSGTVGWVKSKKRRRPGKIGPPSEPETKAIRDTVQVDVDHSANPGKRLNATRDAVMKLLRMLEHEMFGLSAPKIKELLPESHIFPGGKEVPTDKNLLDGVLCALESSVELYRKNGKYIAI